MTHGSRRIGMVIVVLVVALAACGSDDSDDASSSSTAAPPSGVPLIGTPWVLINGAELGVPAEGVTVTAEFADGRVSGNSGCNSYSGTFDVSGNVVSFGPTAGTRMACAPAAMAVEQAYLARLPEVNRYSIADSTLTLVNGNDVTQLVYEASDAGTAVAGSWSATGYFTGSAVQSTIAGTSLTLEFAAEEVSGNGGCNTFGGPYEVSGETIKLGPFGSTLRACADPARQHQEQQYLAALELAVTFRVTADRLDLFREDGGIAATFERLGPA